MRSLGVGRKMGVMVVGVGVCVESLVYDYARRGRLLEPVV
jgi:hypothetical protein